MKRENVIRLTTDGPEEIMGWTETRWGMHLAHIHLGRKGWTTIERTTGLSLGNWRDTRRDAVAALERRVIGIGGTGPEKVRQLVKAARSSRQVWTPASGRS